MTEYDFSPAAQQAYQAKLAGIAQWSRNVPSRPDELTNPFAPTARDDTDFYKSKPKHSSSSTHRHHWRHRSRGRGWDDSSTGSSDDDDEGPDRPPTPPASAPVLASPYGVGVGGGWTSPWQQQQQPVYGAGVASGGMVSPTTNVLVPTWNGSAWVYASPVASPVQMQQPAPAQSSSHRHHRHRDRDRDRERERGRERPKNRRRDSRSVPPPVSPPLLGHTSPSYPGACYVPVANGGSFMVYQPQQQQQQQHLQPTQHQGSSPASAWSAPLPGATSPPAHLSPRPQPQPPAAAAAATGYFGITPAPAPPGGFYGSPPAIGVQVQVQSPAGSVYSYGHPNGMSAWGSPAVSAGWGSAYASPLPSGGVPPGYGGAGGYYGPPGPGVVIVDGARPRKGYESVAVMPSGGGGKRPGSASLRSGKSGRSLWGRFVGGM